MNQNQQIAEFLPVLERFFGTAMADVYRQVSIPAAGDVLLMGCPVWGKKYLDRFQSYCLPSIACQSNFDALKGRTHLVLFTDEASFARLWQMVRILEGGGISAQILLIPQDVMDYLPRDPLNKYWILGVVGNVLLQMAGRMGAGFHSLYPDHLYARGYFANLFRLAELHPAIVQPGISANIETAWKDIEPYRNEDGNLAIADVDLGTIGWRHLHAQTRASLMNRATIPTAMPNSHLLIWQGHEEIVVHCCHANPAYLSPEIVAKIQPRIPATIDAELPAFLAGAPFYTPTITDGLTYLELSDGEKTVVDKMVDFPTFSERAHTHVRFMLDWMPFFERPFRVPMQPQQSGLSSEEIAAQFKEVYEMLLADRARAALSFIPKLVFQT